jgi:putative ABC transport system permease protein
MQETAVSYLKLRPEANMATLEKAFEDECDKHWSIIKEHFAGSTWTFHLQPLSEAAFHVLENDNYSPKSRMKLSLFLVVGIVILIMAWINFLNLKLSTQATRMKELGVRATSGARIRDFINQFLVESLVINGAAVLLSLTLIQLLRTPLALYFQFHVPDWVDVTPETIIVFLTVMAVGTFGVGLHPAITLWKLTLRAALNYNRVSGKGKRFIEVTSIVQFATAIVLIVWLSTVNQQVQFVVGNNWGLNREGVVILDLPVVDSLVGTHPNVTSLKNELLTLSAVQDVTICTTVPGDLIRHRVGFFPGDNHKSWTVPKSDGGVDERFIPFYGLKLLAGRNFTGDASSDHSAVILSREAAKSVGWEPEEAIGKKIDVERYSWRSLLSPGVVIGVIEDHRHSPLYRETTISDANRGTLLTYGNYLFKASQPAKMSIRLDMSGRNMGAIREVFQRFYPGEIFHWYFLDDHMNRHYESEQIAIYQITLFTAIAIVVACLGLLGMITNRVLEKTKEIGIRKILGARLHEIANVLLNATAKQIALAVVFGIPISYFLTQRYLEKFVERVALPWWQYILPVVALILIMLLTILWVLWRAAKSNPVDALKQE